MLVEEALRRWREEDGGERMRREEEGRGRGERETAGEWMRMARNFTNERGEGGGVTRWERMETLYISIRIFQHTNVLVYSYTKISHTNRRERMETLKARIASGLLNHHDALTGTCTKRVAEQLLSDSDAALDASGVPPYCRTRAALAPY